MDRSATKRTYKSHIFQDWLCAQLGKERFGFLQDGRVESFREPVIDRRKYITGFNTPPMMLPPRVHHVKECAGRRVGDNERNATLRQRSHRGDALSSAERPTKHFGS